MRFGKINITTIGPIALLVFASVISLYASGVVTILGNSSGHKKGGVLIGAGGSFDIGLKYFWLQEGWQIYVDYEIEAKAGSLELGLSEYFPTSRKIVWMREYISGNKKGRVTFTAPKSTFYKFYYEGSMLHGSAGKGFSYDIDYSITWGLS